MARVMNDCKLSELEEELDDYSKAILKCLRENLHKYLDENDDAEFWTEEFVKKFLIMEEFEKCLLAKLWEPLGRKDEQKQA